MKPAKNRKYGNMLRALPIKIVPLGLDHPVQMPLSQHEHVIQALAAEGVSVWAIARNAKRIDLFKQEVKGVQTWVSDVALPQTAPDIPREIGPDILVLNTGQRQSRSPSMN